ncbi:Predicted arabinose efflux permease, MFS family [Pseudomonas sp. NFACC02]|uniref:MFS transporter n=1 Tax=Pseudomonas sp. NFACC02 TaxID=1566250 RepID=UPI0008CB9834|nr:MFS transporter [Pseudomonas sp. NFACC02]SEQ87994.1 Predicted arabinose efflux permease, MFS family [Pseudomonas sp. NFACC02]
MSFRKYQKVLAIPRVLPATLFMFVAGLPLTIMTLTLSLHVLNEMGRSYFDAGLVATATALGFAVGSPLLGRMMDRHGLRPVVAVCGALSTIAWVLLPLVNYALFVGLAFAAGLFTIPTGSLSRQFVASLVPEDQRRPAYSLTTMLMELSFVITPAVGILLITAYSATAVLLGIGIWRALSYAALYLLNWPIRHPDEIVAVTEPARPKLREWLNARLISVLLISSGALFVMFGTELALIAVLRENGELAYTGYVIAAMSIASIAGGFVHGIVHRSWSLNRLAVTMSLLLLPVVFFDQVWWWLLLALLPTNLLCTPTLAASSEAIAQLAPAGVRGQVMGLQDSANRMGQTLSMPLVGFAIDSLSPAMGFVAAACGGLVLIAIAALCKLLIAKSTQTG